MWLALTPLRTNKNQIFISWLVIIFLLSIKVPLGGGGGGSIPTICVIRYGVFQRFSQFTGEKLLEKCKCHYKLPPIIIYGTLPGDKYVPFSISQNKLSNLVLLSLYLDEHTLVWHPVEYSDNAAAIGDDGVGQVDSAHVLTHQLPRVVPVHRETHSVKFKVEDSGCLSRTWIFPIPDPGSASKNLIILTQKKTVSKKW